MIIVDFVSQSHYNNNIVLTLYVEAVISTIILPRNVNIYLFLSNTTYCNVHFIPKDYMQGSLGFTRVFQQINSYECLTTEVYKCAIFSMQIYAIPIFLCHIFIVNKLELKCNLLF